jgi:hypothetical protein
MNPTASQIRQMKRECLQYPVELADIPRTDWPFEVRSMPRPPTRVLRNRKFLVQIFEHEAALRITVNRTEWCERTKRMRDDISWDDLQQLKSEAGYGDCCAVELFPPDFNVINVANMRHLWLVPCPAFMWQ